MSGLPTREDLKKYDTKMIENYSNDTIKHHEKACELILRMAKTSINYVILKEHNDVDKRIIPFSITRKMLSKTVEGCRSFYELRHSLQQIGIETKVVKKVAIDEDNIQFDPISKTLTFEHHYPSARNKLLLFV
jgi:hypothetical protein